MRWRVAVKEVGEAFDGPAGDAGIPGLDDVVDGASGLELLAHICDAGHFLEHLFLIGGGMAEGAEAIDFVLEDFDGVEINGGEVAGVARIDLDKDAVVIAAGVIFVRGEPDAGDVERAESLGDDGIGPAVSRDGFEGNGTADAGFDSDFAKEAGGGVTARCADGGDVGRGGNPFQAGVLPDHAADPAFHGDDGEAAGTGEIFGVDPEREFAGGEAVDVGDVVEADEGVDGGVEARAFDADAAERIGAVEDDGLNVVLGAFVHDVTERADEGVGTIAEVLDIVDDGVEAGEHFLGGMAMIGRGRIIKRIDRQAGLGIATIVEFLAGAGQSVDAVFGAEEFDQLVVSCALTGVENGDGGTALGIGAGGIGDEADSLAFKCGEICFFEFVDAEGDRALGMPRQAEEQGGGEQDGLK